MSEETARQLREAREAEAKQRVVVEQLRNECVDTVARELPTRLLSYALKIAHEQPDVTTQLDTAGIAQLKAELTEAAEQLGAELRSSVDRIPWKREGSTTGFDNVGAALGGFLYGVRVNRLTHIIRTHGYELAANASMTVPSLLFAQNSFDELDRAQTDLDIGESFTADAKAADDRSTVDALWASTDR